MLIPGVFSPMAGVDLTIEKILENGTNVVLSSLYTADEWAGPANKKVIVPSGVTIGSTSSSTPAIRTGTGRGGTLEVVIEGTVSGAGGAANSGTGGTAVSFEQGGCTMRGSGLLRGGGGGGGKGGTGGGGVWYSGRFVTETPSYSSSYRWHTYVQSYPGNNYSSSDVTWAGVGVASVPNNTATSMSAGGWTYYRGTFKSSSGETTDSGWYQHGYYTVYREGTVYDVPNNTSGGAGGNGGRGQGYDGSAAGGSAGSNGGTNAGKGGTGGTGGGYGVSGGTGSTGAAGNRTSGSAGVTGGLAGYAIFGTSNVNNLFTGTTTGRTG